MVLFKEIKKTSVSDSRNTLFSKINERIAFYNKEQEITLPKLKKQYKSIMKKLKDKKEEFPKDPEYWEVYWELMDIHDDIHKDIHRIEHDNEYIEYMLNIIPFIEMYINEENKIDEMDKVKTVPMTNKTFSNFIHITGNVSKGDIYKRYMFELEGDSSMLDFNATSQDVCPHCEDSIEMICDDSDMVCPVCGYSMNYIDSTLKFTSYQQDFEMVNYIAYKRINHFNEWLSQFQGNESTVVPQEVFDKLVLEFKKIRMTKTDTIKSEKIREFLKKLKLNKYYEHIPYILRVMQGKKPPSLTYKMEETLRKMFIDIQDPFTKACPKNRKNFLSYSYVIHKFCELLEYDEFLESFPLLKSREKLYQQDVIWKSICNELKWEFIPSL